MPEGVDLTVASTLPVAGLTVMRTLGLAGSVLGARVLVTGASGGVGQLAVPLAAMSGAAVTAVTSRTDLWPELRDLGARDVVGSIGEARGSFDLILESVGGESLAAAIGLVGPRGIVVTIGNSSEKETTFNSRTLYAKGGASLYGLIVFDEVECRRVGERELERLLDLVRDGMLRPSLALRRPFEELDQALTALGAPGKPCSRFERLASASDVAFQRPR